MTTNLWETLDVAIESRIHVHLRFSELPRSHREQIWSRFLSRAQTLGGFHNLTPMDVSRVSNWKMNGRQIKNVFRMALAVSRYKKEPITCEGLNNIIPMCCPYATPEDAGEYPTSVP